MARDDERDGLENTGYRSGRVRIVGAEPAGRSAATRSEDEGPTDWDASDWDDDERSGDTAAPESVVPPLPHWTEPATGEVPAILSRGPEDENADPFASMPGPTWREEGADWEAQGEDFEPSMLAGDKTGQGSLDTGPSDRQPWVFDLPGSGSSTKRIFGDAQEWDDDDSAWEDLTKNVPAPSWVSDGEQEEAAGPITEVIPVVGEQADPFEPFGPAEGAASSVPLDEAIVVDDIDDPMGPPRSRFRSMRSERRPPAAPERRPAPPRRPSPADRLHPPAGLQIHEAPPQRNVALAIVSGLVLGAVALICFKVGPVASIALVTVVVTMAAAEAYAAFRHGGYHPVTLLGLVGTVSLMIAAYNKGEEALPLVLVLLIAFCFIWHLAGVETTDTVRSIGTTLFVFGWIGVFGFYAALLVSPNLFADRHGIAFLLGGIIAVVAYDVGALTFGAWLGRHPLASVSPNKTWEGFVGGLITSVVITTVVVHLIHPWTVGKAATLGLVVSIVATLGDLFESTVKRHLGRKDMGRLMPGHGGLLDRVDGLLFVLPATFYLVIAFHMG